MFTVSINSNGEILKLKNTVNYQVVRFHAFWLRDNSPDKETRSFENGQKLITLKSIPKNIKISFAKVKKNKIEILFKPENKLVQFDINWLINNNYDKHLNFRNKGWLSENICLWDKSSGNNIQVYDYNKVISNEKTLYKFLNDVVKFGFVKLIKGPKKEKSLFDIVSLFGFVRETNYGKYFDVRNKINPSNLAFTNKGLQAHTDNPYRDPVPTIQILYCIKNSVDGGESMVVDGFNAAKKLQDENYEWFNILSNYCATFEFFLEKNIRLISKKPMIELNADGELICIRFNNRSTSAINGVPFTKMKTYYNAYRRFGEIIDNEEMELKFSLNPGECFIVDNTRVLHARKTFSSNQGYRWFQGCYADKDALLSKHKILFEKLRIN